MISVIIATKNRPKLLKRALISVLFQTHKIHEVIIINDSNEEYQKQIMRHISYFSKKLHIKLISAPIPGNPCVSWNKGASIASGNLLAFLDDDDEWLPTYISNCIDHLQKEDLDLVLCGFWRKKKFKQLKKGFLPPNELSLEMLYIQNIGLRTSNLFIRKSVFLEVGGFNESLLTSTDRGLSIRLAKFKNLKYKPLEERLVIYHKHNKGQMISSKHPTRYSGIIIFYEMFCNFMTLTEKRFFFYRVMRFWGWDLFKKYNIEKYQIKNKKLTNDLTKIIFSWVDRESNTEDLELYYQAAYKRYLNLLSKTKFDEKLINIWHIISRQYESECELYRINKERRPIVIGMVNTNRSKSLRNFLESLLKEITIFGLEKYLHKSNEKLIIVLIDNCNQINESKQNEALVKFHITKNGLDIKYYNIMDCLDLINYESKEISKLPLSIAESRKILSKILCSINLPENAIYWILDDCIQFGSLVLSKNNFQLHHTVNSFSLIWLIDALFPKIKILIGENTGTAPLPLLSTINNQICDFLRNLKQISRKKSDEIYIPKINSKLFNESNYYHDFLYRKKTIYPFIVGAIKTYKEMLQDYLDSFNDILNGYPITRPLVITKATKFNLKNTKQKTILRGGNTIIFDFEIIKNNLHPIPTYKGKPIRRSDIIWAIERKNQGIICNKSPVILHKHKQISNENLVHTLITDIYGHVLYNWLLSKNKNKTHLKKLFRKRKSSIKKKIALSLDTIKIINSEISKIVFLWKDEFSNDIKGIPNYNYDFISKLLEITLEKITKLEIPVPDDYLINNKDLYVILKEMEDANKNKTDS